MLYIYFPQESEKPSNVNELTETVLKGLPLDSTKPDTLELQDTLPSRYSLWIKYRPFHKTLLRFSVSVNVISVRFYETGCTLKRCKTL